MDTPFHQGKSVLKGYEPRSNSGEGVRQAEWGTWEVHVEEHGDSAGLAHPCQR